MGALKAGCDRAREWVSLELDGELSELEQALLASHLERCTSCAVFARELRAFSSMLRSAPLERAPALLAGQVPPRARVRVVHLAAAAAAIAVAGALGSLAGALSSHGTPQPSAAAAVAATQQPYVEQKLLALDARRLVRVRGGDAVPV